MVAGGAESTSPSFPSPASRTAGSLHAQRFARDGLPALRVDGRFVGAKEPPSSSGRIRAREEARRRDHLRGALLRQVRRRLRFVAPDPEGKGALLAMRAALEKARLNPSDLGYINGTALRPPWVTWPRSRASGRSSRGTPRHAGGFHQSYHGHLLGATAGLEAIITALASRRPRPATSTSSTGPALPPVVLPTGC
jgi:hypothetical protein